MQAPLATDEESVESSLSVSETNLDARKSQAGNPSFSLTPPTTTSMSSIAMPPAAPMGNGGSSTIDGSAAVNGSNGLGGSSGKAGFTMSSSSASSSSAASLPAAAASSAQSVKGNPSSSRSPPYYNDLGGMGKSTGARAPPITVGTTKERAGHRKRSSSLVTVEKIEQSHEELLDQSAGFNANADWVNYKGESV
jgi:hypothetical protein